MSIPQRLCGLRVLLIESERMLLQHHASVLRDSSYRDADLPETDLEDFLRQVLSHHPHMSIIVMASKDIYSRIPREALEIEPVLCLRKPCRFRDIRNIWKHVCRNGNSSETQVKSNVLRVSPRVEPSTINRSTAINYNISSQALDMNSQEHDGTYKQVTYADLFPNDDVGDQEDFDEISPKEYVGIGTTNKEDKGKQPLILKRKNDQPDEEERYPKKRKNVNTRITWKGELEDKFKTAVKELGEQAQSSLILKHMNVPGLTRFHVASHLQKHQKKIKLVEASLATLAQRGRNLGVDRFASERYLYSTQSDENASANKSSSPMILPSLNSKGILYMRVRNIRAKLQEAPPLPNNNYGGEKETDHSLGVVEFSNSGGQGTEIQLIGHNYGNALEPQQVIDEASSHHVFGEAMAPLSGYQATDHRFRAVEISNSGGQGTGIQLIGHNYGNALEPQQVTGETSSHHAFGEAMAPLGVGATVASDENLEIDSDSLFNGLDNGIFGDASGSGPSEVQVQPPGVGPAPEPWVADFQDVVALLNHRPEDLDLARTFSFDAGNHYPSQDFQVNRENLGPVVETDNNFINPGSNLDSIPFEPASANFSIPEFPTVENVNLAEIQLPVNSGVPLDGSEARYIGNDVGQSELENTLNLRTVDDGNLFNGRFYF